MPGESGGLSAQVRARGRAGAEVCQSARPASIRRRSLEWVGESLHKSHADERREHEDAIRRLQAEHKRFGDRINAMYLDKRDERVDSAFFDKMSAQWRDEQNRCLREIARHESAEQSYMDEGVQILELARNAHRLFERRQPRENAGCSILYYRTAVGRTAKWLPPSGNRLIYWRKPLLS